jgi:hypothetical protein
MVVKPPEALAKKGTSSHSSKRLKKASATSISLDTHRPVGSADDVSTAPCGLPCRWISCRKNTGYHATDPKDSNAGG